MDATRAWVHRHKVLAAIFLLWSLLSLSTLTAENGSAGVAITLILFGAAVAWILGKVFRSRKKSTGNQKMQPSQQFGVISPSRSAYATASQVPGSVSNTKTTSSATDMSRISTNNQRMLAQLEPNSRITAFNALKVDEAILFLLPDARVSIVGTDQRILFVPAGKKGLEGLKAIPYLDVTGAVIEPRNSGGVLNIQAYGRSSLIELKTPTALDRGMQVAQQIRVLAHSAHVTAREQMAPPQESAFAETARQVIPRSTGALATMNLGDLLMMTPYEFEIFTAQALEAMGYSDMKVVGGSGDLAADISGRDPQGRSVVVQCKRYTPGSRVGSPAIQQFIGMKSVHHAADRGIFVTTADYSVEATNLAREHDIVLLDGDDLVKIAALLLARGESLSPASVAGDKRFKFCGECGEKIAYTAQFCPKCGSKADMDE